MNKNAIFLAYVALFVSPAFFSTNVIFGRAAQSIEPFTLAFLRWGISAFILLLLCRGQWPALVRVFKSSPRTCLLQGFLAMWVCGAMVYLALKYTSATNGTLIYTTPPVMIILIEAIFKGRRTSLREIAGVLLAFAGVLAILIEADIGKLYALSFNPGDLIFVFAAIAWSIYSVVLKSEQFSSLETIPLFALIAVCGAAIVLPFSIAEIAITGNFPLSSDQWAIIAGIVVFSSLISFSTFQFGIKIVGPSISGIFMYLLPLYGITMAWLFLDERLADYHYLGMVMILAGVILATLPVALFRSRSR